MNLKTILLGLATSSFATTVSAQNCMSTAQMLNYTASELSNVTPCDQFASAFLRYNEIATKSSLRFDYTIALSDQYYLWFRANEGTSIATPHAEVHGNLIAALALVPEQGAFRHNAYKAAISFQYMASLGDDFQNIGRVRFALAAIIEEGVARTGLSNVTQLNCFIKADAPKLTPSDILSSVFYKDCIQKSQ